MNDPRIRIDVHAEDLDPAVVRAEIRRGLLKTPREVSCKSLYDDLGTALYERICALPEYYPWRTERNLLASVADRVAAVSDAAEVLEFGSGAGTKTLMLLDALERRGRLKLYSPFDLNEKIVRRSADQLVASYPGLRVHGVVGDFTKRVPLVPSGDRRLIAFLGGTIGNFRPDEAVAFLSRIAEKTAPGNCLLLGAILVTDRKRLVAAYDDAAGVSADFNRNILAVMNAMLDGDFDPAAFAHRALWDERNLWIEMRLVSTRRQAVRLKALDLEMEIAEGEEIHTEISAKYDRAAVEGMLVRGGFRPLEWFEDPENLFALALARR